jgi:hypothetical protein
MFTTVGITRFTSGAKLCGAARAPARPGSAASAAAEAAAARMRRRGRVGH